MPQAVPPVEEERAGEPREETFQRRRVQPMESRERDASQRVVPDLIEAQRDRHLHAIDRQRAQIPARDRGGGRPGRTRSSVRKNSVEPIVKTVGNASSGI